MKENGAEQGNGVKQENKNWLRSLQKRLGKVFAYELERALLKLKKSLQNTKEKFFNEQEFRRIQSKEEQEER